MKFLINIIAVASFTLPLNLAFADHHKDHTDCCDQKDCCKDCKHNEGKHYCCDDKKKAQECCKNCKDKKCEKACASGNCKKGHCEKKKGNDSAEKDAT